MAAAALHASRELALTATSKQLGGEGYCEHLVGLVCKEMMVVSFNLRKTRQHSCTCVRCNSTQ